MDEIVYGSCGCPLQTPDNTSCLSLIINENCFVVNDNYLLINE